MDDYLADHGLTQKFERLVNSDLLDIQSLRLEWCKMKYFPQKQWLAENELALARIIPFVYGLFFMNLELPTRMNTSPETNPANQQLFHLMHVMMCVLMSPRDPLAPEIDKHVKMILSCCHRFSKSYYKGDEKPFGANTDNFPTLLCLADQRRRHRPIRLYWEGTSERFIQKLKRVLTSMRRTTQYFSGKLTLMYKTNVMEWLTDQFKKENSDDKTNEHNQWVGKMYNQYVSLEEIKRKMRVGEVMSGFTFQGNTDKIIIAYGEHRRSGVMKCIGITRYEKDYSKHCIGIAYVKCELDNTMENALYSQEIDVKEVESMIKHYCLLLPLMKEGNFNNEFVMVYDDWDVGDEHFRKSLPSLCPMCFETDVLR